MASQVKSGSFALNNATGNQVVSWATGGNWPSSATPKLVLFFATGQTADGTAQHGIGMLGAAASSTQRWVLSQASDDAAAAVNSGQSARTNACIVLLSNGTPTVQAVADFVSFGAEQFTINITTAPGVTGIQIGYIVFGGADITNVAVGSSTIPTATGNQTISPTGFAGVTPDCLLTAVPYQPASPTESVHSHFGLGWATRLPSVAQGVAWMMEADGSAAIDTQRGFLTTCCVGGAEAAITGHARGSLGSFGSGNAVVNWLDAAAAANNIWLYVAIAGGGWQCFSDTEATTNTGKATAVSGFGANTPKGLLLIGSNGTADTVSTDTANGDCLLALGASDGTTELSVANIQANGSGNTANSLAKRRLAATKALSLVKVPTTASPWATVCGEADATFQAGQVTLTWTGTDGTARKLLGLAVGDNPPPPQTPNPPTAATTGAKGCVGFAVSWSASAVDGTHDTPTGYLLDVATDSGFTAFVSGYNGLNVGTATSALITGLAAGTAYWWRVRATNGGGTSANAAPSPASATTDAAPADTYGAAVAATPGLVSYWRLDEPSGNPADLALGFTGTITPTVTQNATGLLASTADAAATFDGASGAVVGPNAWGFAGTPPFSVELWFNPTTVDTTFRRLICKSDSSTTGWNMVYHSTSGLYLTRWVAGANQDTPKFTPVAASTTHHAVATYDGSTLRLYVDGAEVSTGLASAGAISATAAGLMLGNQTGGGGALAGRLDEVALYNVALSLATVQDHYTKGTTAGTGTQTLALAGVGSGERGGAPAAIPGPVAVALAAALSAEAPGQPATTPAYTAPLASVGTAEAAGQPALSTAYTAALSGAASGERVGPATVLPGGVALLPTGAASAEVAGQATVAVLTALALAGAASTEAAGVPTLLPGAVALAIAGAGSGELAGQPIVGVFTFVAPAGVGSGERAGQPAALPGGLTLPLVGVGSGEQAGPMVAFTVGAPATLALVGTGTGERVGGVLVLPGVVPLTPAGVGSGERAGLAMILPGGLALPLAGVGSGEQRGAPALSTLVALGLTGFGSGERAGAGLVLPGVVTLALIGARSGERAGMLAIGGIAIPFYHFVAPAEGSALVGAAGGLAFVGRAEVPGGAGAAAVYVFVGKAQGQGG